MADKVRDPVCGAKVATESKHAESYANSRYVFCSETCRERFKTNPQNYVSQTG